MLVTWPFLLLVLDFWPLRRFPSSPPAFFAFFRGYSPLRLIHQSTNPPIHHPSSLPRLLLEKLPFLALSVTSCLVTMWAQKGAISSFETFPVSFRFINAPRAWVGYLGKLCWPTNLSVFYRFPDNLTFSMAILPLLLLLAITLAAWFLRKSRPYFFSGWLWYLGTLVPVIGIIQVGSQSMADRYTYIPSIGLFFAVAWLVADLLSKRPIPSPSTREEQVGRGLGRGAAHINLSIHQSTNPSSSLEPATSNLQPSPSPSPSSIIHHPSSLPLALAAAAILALCATLTFQQAKVWRTSRTLFEHARKVTDRNFLAATVLGRLLQNEGKPAEALESFRLATQYAPLFPSGWYGMGTTLYALGKPQEGDQAFEQALRLNPEDLEGLDTYGLALLNTKRFVQAEPVFVKVLDLRPNYAEGHLHLALALQGQDKIAEALPHFQQAVALKPEGFEVHYAYAQLLGTQKRFPEAIAQYQAALQIQPNSLDSHLGLGAALVETGGWEKAAEQFSTVLAASPTNSSALDGLGYTLAMRGKFEEALLYFVKAAEAAPSNSFPHLHLAMEYERRKDIPKAIEQLRLAVQCSPGMTAALNDLAWILATNPDPKFRDGAEAVRMAEQACKNTKDSEPLFMGTLAAAYAEAGRFDDAIRTAEKARDLAKSMGLNEVVRRNEELLPLYRAHKPYHEPK
jgi:tetratricopeptide (TPR) repeat protein